jgi:Fe2+ transport system protein FeoA
VVGRRACAAERAHAARIGVLLASETDDPEYVARMKAFTDRLVELGWIEGRNIQIERRWGSANAEQTPRLRRPHSQKGKSLLICRCKRPKNMN